MIDRFLPRPKLDRWDDYFEEGEVLLWQGQPEPGLKAFWGPLLLSIFGIPFLFAGLAALGSALRQIVGMDGFADLGVGLFLTAFSVPFLGLGLGLVFGSWVYSFYGDRFTRYALSNKRAYVAQSFPRHVLTSYRIGADDMITLDQGKFDNVKFKTVHDRDSDGDKTTRRIGFDGIRNGHEVYALIRKIQTGLS